MNKEEFLQGLRRALSSTGSESLIQENLSFYRSYIDGEMAKNRSEEEVLAELGDPRLIANSIREAAGLNEDRTSFRGGEEEFQEKNKGHHGSFGGYRPSRGVSNGVILGIIFLLLFIVLVVIIVGGILTLLAPILVPVSLVVLIVWMFRRRS